MKDKKLEFVFEIRTIIEKKIWKKKNGGKKWRQKTNFFFCHQIQTQSPSDSKLLQKTLLKPS